MNALVKKEIRLLLPSFLIGLALAFSMLLVPKDLSGNNWKFLFVVGMICCPAIVVMMSLDSFGRELSAGTLANLLVQPVPRARIWWTKVALLFVALAIVFAAWWFSFLLGWPFKTSPQETREMLLATVIFVLTTYSGGLWTVLLLRQVGVAFWFTLLVPAGMLVVFVSLLGEKHPDQLTPVIVTALFIYSIGGFLFAWRLFLRAQDTQWTGATISLPQWRILPAMLTGTGTKRGRRPLAAMFAREFQLHQSQLIIAGGLALLHLGVIVARGIGHGFKQYPTVEFVLGQLWYLWLVMPVLIGCAAVAEERKLRTLESELCLPARRRTQFAIKLGVVLLFSALLGAVMPVLLEGIKILPNTHLDANLKLIPEYLAATSSGRILQFILHWLVLISDWLGFLMFAAICAGIGAIAFYFSTLTRHTLQAFGPAVLGIFSTVYLLFAAFKPERFIDCVPWRGCLVYLIGVPTLTLTLAGLAYWNYKRVLVGWPAWRRNLLTVLVAFTFVIASTTALYHRAWELAMPLEPAHGPARLAPSSRVTVQHEVGSLAVGLPDGRYWSGNFGFSISLTALLTSDWRLKELAGGSRFLAGTNWADVADCIFDTVGIQDDGSLWISTKPLPREFYFNPRNVQVPTAKPSPLLRVGDEHDWKSVVSSGRNAVLLKNDGTLWTLGSDRPNPPNGWPGLMKFPLEQVGTDSDWEAIERISSWLWLRKKDGRVWSNIYSVKGTDGDGIKIFQYPLERTDFPDEHQWRGAAWAQATFEVAGGGFIVGVRDDGTFRVMARWQPVEKSSRWEVAAQDIQLGRETNWLGMAAAEGDVITVRADGSLWRWRFPVDPGISPGSAVATRFGTHSDCIAIHGISGGIVSLSADGGLWYWRFDSRHGYGMGIPLPPLIGASRKPLRIAGIFDKAE